MPEAEMRRAQEKTLAFDLFLAVGSSLVVYPAAGFPALAKQSGVALVIVDREPTDFNDLAGVAWRARDQGAYPGTLCGPQRLAGERLM